ncbi:hypothetical protein Tco_0401471 [Tanacetum coccineum]
MRKQRKDTEVPQPTESVADETEEDVPIQSNDLPLLRVNTLRSGEDKTTKTNQALEIDSLKRRVKKLEKKKRSGNQKLKRLYRVGLSARIESSEDEEVTLVDETQGRNDEDMLFDVNDDLQGEKVVVEKEVAEKEVSTADPVTTAGEVVTTISTAATIIPEEVTLAQVLVQIKTSKPKAKGIVFKKPSESTTTTPIPIVTPQQLPQAKDKGKEKMIKPEKPLKKKDQIMFDEKEEAEMKKHMEIVFDDEELVFDAIPLTTKPPTIVDYKIIKEGKMGYFQLIRADGSSRRYSSMIQMLQNINREDLENLWNLVKAKHGNIRPKEGYERVL